MKKTLLVVAMLTVLLMTGCNKDSTIQNNEIQSNQNNEQQIDSTNVSSEIKNKFAIVENLPKTYTSKDWDGVTSENVDDSTMLVGKYVTYSTISIENSSNNAAISNINKFLENLIRLDDDEYETQLPEDFGYPINIVFKEFYQNEDIIVIEKIGNGFTGTGAGYADIKYYVFDKNDGHLLELEDISRNPKSLIEYLYNTPAISDLENDEVTNWRNLGQNSINLPYEYFEKNFEGTWAITNDEFIVSQHGTQSAGPCVTIRYKLSKIETDLDNGLYNNLIILSRKDKDEILNLGNEKYNRAKEIYSSGRTNIR